MSEARRLPEQDLGPARGGLRSAVHLVGWGLLCTQEPRLRTCASAALGGGEVVLLLLRGKENQNICPQKF